MLKYRYLTSFTIAEIKGLACRVSVQRELPMGEGFYQDSLEALDVFGGFPEPFIRQSKRQLRR
ncbi:MAG TPA: hypothetical protein ENH24_03970 [Nitrospirae bacterium]|nr:hypothetical protein [Nitrospirota bacterium]